MGHNGFFPAFDRALPAPDHPGLQSRTNYEAWNQTRPRFLRFAEPELKFVSEIYQLGNLSFVSMRRERSDPNHFFITIQKSDSRVESEPAKTIAAFVLSNLVHLS